MKLTSQQYALYYGTKILFPETNETDTLNWAHLVQVEHGDEKPSWRLLLRPLPDITEEEFKEWLVESSVTNTTEYPVLKHRGVLGDYVYGCSDFLGMRYLLSKGFDLFNWIEQGACN